MPINFFYEWAVRRFGKSVKSDQVRVNDHWGNLHSEIKEIRECSSLSELLILFSHYSGFIREAAISQSASFQDPSVIVPLIVRLNDWVPQVRLAAQNALKTYLVNENTAVLVSLLPEFAKLRTRGRARHEELLTEVDELLLKPENISSVVNGLKSPDSKVVRECYRLVAHSNTLPKTELVLFALRSKDLLVAVDALSLLKELPDQARQQAIQIGLRSSFSSLRSAMLLALLRSPSENRNAVAQSMLFDRQQMVREIACGWLAEQGEDVLKHYTNVLDSTNQPASKIRCALWAMVKFKIVAALPKVLELTKSSSPKIRSAAILTCAKLDSEKIEAGKHGVRSSFVAHHMIYPPPPCPALSE